MRDPDPLASKRFTARTAMRAAFAITALMGGCG